MSDRCLNPEELADLTANITSDDPRRAHLDECPRCQAVMKSFVAFMDPADIPSGAKVADAHERLSAALDREIGVDADAAAAGAAESQVIRPTPGFWTPFRVRTIAAAAAVVIVAVGLSQVRLESVDPGSEPVLRGVGTPNEALQISLTRQENGSFWVNWPGVAEATGYRVVVYGEDLEEIMGFDVGLDTAFKFRPVDGAAFCRVIVFRDGDEVGRSGPVYFGDC